MENQALMDERLRQVRDEGTKIADRRENQMQM